MQCKAGGAKLKTNPTHSAVEEALKGVPRASKHDHEIPWDPATIEGLSRIDEPEETTTKPLSIWARWKEFLAVFTDQGPDTTSYLPK